MTLPIMSFQETENELAKVVENWRVADCQCAISRPTPLTEHGEVRFLCYSN